MFQLKPIALFSFFKHGAFPMWQIGRYYAVFF